MLSAGKAQSVHNRVGEVRMMRGLTQERLAQAVEVTRQSIIAIEKGRFTPSIYTALKLAQALQTRVDDLFWLSESEKEQK
jgi:putative transcriptional regulator